MNEEQEKYQAGQIEGLKHLVYLLGAILIQSPRTIARTRSALDDLLAGFPKGTILPPRGQGIQDILLEFRKCLTEDSKELG